MDLSGWTPLRVRWTDATPMIDWIHLGNRRFTEPFWGDTMDSVLRDPAALLFQRTTTIPGSSSAFGRPAGFIYHMSRCGSTLVAQMLAALEDDVVLSEPEPFDQVLRGGPADVRDDDRIDWLRYIVHACGGGRGARVYVKLDCWHMCYFPLIRRAFPNVPWVFVYRDPVEVLVSLINKPGMWTVPGALPQWIGGVGSGQARDEYIARVLSSILTSAIEHIEDGGRLVSYNSLPAPGLCKILRWFDVHCTGKEIAHMTTAGKMDAKSRGIPFLPDAETKRRAASDRIVELAEQYMLPAYERLERIRGTYCER